MPQYFGMKKNGFILLNSFRGAVNVFVCGIPISSQKILKLVINEKYLNLKWFIRELYKF